MEEQSTPETDAEPTSESLTDPDALSVQADVERCEHTFVHDDADHCEADVEGRAIVGVTNDDGGVLVLEHDEAPYPILPNDTVEHGEDWAEVARQAGQESAGVPVELDGPLRVRDVEHVVEGEDEPHSETSHVVFRASLATAVEAGDSPFPDDCDWTVHWLEELPETLVENEEEEKEEVEEAPVEDVRLVLD